MKRRYAGRPTLLREWLLRVSSLTGVALMMKRERRSTCAQCSFRVERAQMRLKRRTTEIPLTRKFPTCVPHTVVHAVFVVYLPAGSAEKSRG